MVPLKISRRRFIAASACACLAACSVRAPGSQTGQNDTVKLHPRRDWNARLPNLDAPVEHGLFDPEFNPEGWLMYAEPLAKVYNTLILHHSALDLSYGPRRIQDLHMDVKGYADIGYHYVVDGHGRVSEGRTIRARGAHTGGFNTGTIGVVLLGNFEQAEPTEMQWQAARRLGRYLADTYNLTHLAGHRDFQPAVTVCPGKELARRLPDLAADLELAYGTKGYVTPAWAQK